MTYPQFQQIVNKKYGKDYTINYFELVDSPTTLVAMKFNLKITPKFPHPRVRNYFGTDGAVNTFVKGMKDSINTISIYFTVNKPIPSVLPMYSKAGINNPRLTMSPTRPKSTMSPMKPKSTMSPVRPKSSMSPMTPITKPTTLEHFHHGRERGVRKFKKFGIFNAIMLIILLLILLFIYYSFNKK